MTLTIKQENFCMKYIEAGNASEAYRKAYDAENMKPEVIHVKANELLNNGKVTVRIEELQAEHRKRHAVTVDSLTIELDKAKEFAYQHESPAAVISAIMAKAKIHGLETNKLEVKNEQLFTEKDRLALVENWKKRVLAEATKT